MYYILVRLIYAFRFNVSHEVYKITGIIEIFCDTNQYDV